MDVEDEYIAKDWDGQKEKGTDKQVLHQAQLEIGTYTNTKSRLTIIVNVLCKSSINEIQYRIFYPLRKLPVIIKSLSIEQFKLQTNIRFGDISQ